MTAVETSSTVMALASLGNMATISERLRCYEKAFSVEDEVLVTNQKIVNSAWTVQFVKDVFENIENKEMEQWSYNQFHRLFVDLNFEIQLNTKAGALVHEKLTPWLLREGLQLVKKCLQKGQAEVGIKAITAWGIAIKLLGFSVVQSSERTNICASVFPTAIRANNTELVKAAFRAWRVLAKVLSCDPCWRLPELSHEKSARIASRLDLILKALKYKSSAEIALEVFECWWFCCTSLEARLASHFEEIAHGLLRFCVGGSTEYKSTNDSFEVILESVGRPLDEKKLVSLMNHRLDGNRYSRLILVEIPAMWPKLLEVLDSLICESPTLCKAKPSVFENSAIIRDHAVYTIQCIRFCDLKLPREKTEEFEGRIVNLFDNLLTKILNNLSSDVRSEQLVLFFAQFTAWVKETRFSKGSLEECIARIILHNPFAHFNPNHSSKYLEQFKQALEVSADSTASSFVLEEGSLEEGEEEMEEQKSPSNMHKLSIAEEDEEIEKEPELSDIAESTAVDKKDHTQQSDDATEKTNENIEFVAVEQQQQPPVVKTCLDEKVASLMGTSKSPERSTPTLTSTSPLLAKNVDTIVKPLLADEANKVEEKMESLSPGGAESNTMHELSIADEDEEIEKEPELSYNSEATAVDANAHSQQNDNAAERTTENPEATFAEQQQPPAEQTALDEKTSFPSCHAELMDTTEPQERSAPTLEASAAGKLSEDEDTLLKSVVGAEANQMEVEEKTTGMVDKSPERSDSAHNLATPPSTPSGILRKADSASRKSLRVQFNVEETSEEQQSSSVITPSLGRLFRGHRSPYYKHKLISHDPDESSVNESRGVDDMEQQRSNGPSPAKRPTSMSAFGREWPIGNGGSAGNGGVGGMGCQRSSSVGAGSTPIPVNSPSRKERRSLVVPFKTGNAVKEITEFIPSSPKRSPSVPAVLPISIKTRSIATDTEELCTQSVEKEDTEKVEKKDQEEAAAASAAAAIVEWQRSVTSSVCAALVNSKQQMLSHFDSIVANCREQMVAQLDNAVSGVNEQILGFIEQPPQKNGRQNKTAEEME